MKTQGRYVYKQPPQFKHLDPLTSFEEYEKIRNQLLMGGSTKDAKLRFLHQKLDTLAYIKHLKQIGAPLSQLQELELLIEEHQLLQLLVHDEKMYVFCFVYCFCLILICLLLIFCSLKSPEFKICQNEKEMNKRLFHRMMTKMLASVYDELLVCYAQYARRIKARCGAQLAKMQYDTFECDAEGKYAEKFLSDRITMKTSLEADNCVDIMTCMRQIIEELWNPDLDKQLENGWKHVIKYMLDQLPPEWKDSIKEKFFKQLWRCQIDLLGWNYPAQYTYKHKSLLFNIKSRAVLDANRWYCFFGKYHKKISALLGKSKMWPFKNVFEVFIFLLKNFRQLYSYAPSKLITKDILLDPGQLAIRILVDAVLTLFATTSLERFKSRDSLVKSIMDVDKYQIASEINYMNPPHFLNKYGHAVQDLCYNIHNDKDHITMKYSPAVIPMMVAVVDKHSELLLKFYDEKGFKDGNSLQSDFGNHESLDDFGKSVCDNYVMDWTPLTKQQSDAIKHTINTLSTQSLSPNVEYAFGICNKVKDIAEEGIYMFVFILCYCSYIFIFWFF